MSTKPQTAFTFDVLNTFHLLTLQGKLSAYDFYLSIDHKTNNAGNLELPRAGLGMTADPISSTPMGAYAVNCPACPHPGINLPNDWRNTPTDVGWVYGLNLTIDANFRLKNKDHQLDYDTPLGDGWGHWVPAAPYKAHLEANANEPELNLCDSELRAVDHANKCRSKGYVSTGVAGVVCARHGLVRRNGMGNLQKGEQYGYPHRNVNNS
ncbi:hypothetical protein EYR36_010158 [Pleurotus pulmonarius]|nr:hypothetical protein EYR36_010158 [Pleurotus pulmonarius]